MLWQPNAGAVRGSLVLDATTSAVRARANIYQKAAHLLQRHPSAIAIVVSGGEIRWWTAQPRSGHPEDKRFHVVTPLVDRGPSLFEAGTGLSTPVN